MGLALHDNARLIAGAMMGGEDSSKPPVGTRLPGPGSPADQTLDCSAPYASSHKQGESNVSIMSKTPPPSNPDNDITLDSVGRDMPVGPGGFEVVTARVSKSGRPGDGLSFSARVQPGMDFGPRFRIEKVLGAGGMGTVYKAFDKELSRTVAIKTLRPELVSDPQVTQRFKQELLLASKISHRNILRIHDLGEVDDVKYITMAFIDGKDLSQLMKDQRPFPIERAVQIARQLCEALDAAHSEGVVHRDLKPHNVLVGQDDHVYVSDFGLATSFETAQMGMTVSGAVIGTPRYMSPEQVEGKPADSRSDLYSLGLVLYELVTQGFPFAEASAWQLMYQRVREQPKDVKQVNPVLPDYLARVIMHCLEKDPANRYQSAKEILEDLDAGRSPTRSLISTLRANLPSVTRRPAQAVGAGLLLLIILFVAIPKTRQWIFRTPAISTQASAAGLPSISQGKYIAVLPFRVLGDQASLGYVADGLGEAISAKLFQLRDVRLASSTAAATIDPQSPLPQIAKQLGVNLVVHGTVQGAGNGLRITINLENMAENRLVWSQEFAGVTGDLLTIEDHIYTGLVDALEAKPSNDEMAAASAHPTENVEAYNQYLKGRDALSGTLDDKTIQEAVNYFEGALQKDPEFALAYAGLADADRTMYEHKQDKYWSQQAVEAAKRAAELNDKLPEVHFALGSAYAATGQRAQAIVEQKRALELAPNSDEGYRRLGNAYEKDGQKKEAVQALEKAVEINPYYWINLTALGMAYSDFGEFDKALKLFSQVIQLQPDNPAAYSNLGATYFSLGQYEQSVEAFQKSLQIKPAPDTYTNLGTSLFYLKRYSEAVPMFEKAVEMSPEDEMDTGNLADGYRWAGDKAKALATYEKAIGLAYQALRVNPRDATVIGHLALYYAKKGDLQQAKQFIRKARAIDGSNVYLDYIAAVVDTIDNHPAEAVTELTTAVEKGFSPRDVEMDPEFGPLQSRPDFQSILKRSSAQTP